MTVHFLVCRIVPGTQQELKQWELLSWWWCLSATVLDSLHVPLPAGRPSWTAAGISITCFLFGVARAGPGRRLEDEGHMRGSAAFLFQRPQLLCRLRTLAFLPQNWRRHRLPQLLALPSSFTGPQGYLPNPVHTLKTHPF